LVGSLKLLMQRQQVRRVLSEIRVYKNLDSAVLERVLASFKHIHNKQGECVVEEGEAWSYFSIILDGTVQVANKARGVLGEMGPGKWFGDFKTPTAMASIICKADTTIARLSTNDFSRATISSTYVTHEQSKAATVRVRSLQESKEIHFNQLKMYNVLGVGTFSKVRLTHYRDQESNKDFWFAMKCIDKRTVVQHGAEAQIMNEVDIIQKLDHPFIIALSATFKDENKLYMLTELVQGGEFFTFIANRGILSDEESRFYAANVLLAVEYMHNHNIVYRDLKPENIVMASNGYLKLVDLGFAKRMTSGQTYTVCGTPDYIAPEIVASKGHNKAVDWWSLGVLLFEMLTGLTPYYDPQGNVFKIYERIMKEQLQFPKEPKLCGEVKALITSLLFVKPERRLGSFKVPYKPSVKKPEELLSVYDEEPEETFTDFCRWDPPFDLIGRR